MGASLSSLKSRPGAGYLLAVSASIGLLAFWWAQKPLEVCNGYAEHKDRKASSLVAERPKSESFNSGNFDDLYANGRQLGEGNYGTVKQAKRKSDGHDVAVKVLEKNNSRVAAREVSIMQSLDHPNIVKLLDAFEADNSRFYLVLELCSGGELFDRIIEEGHCTEMQAKHCMRQILLAMQHCHSRQICLRGSKPEDILLSTKAPLQEATLKLIDFGMACEYQSDVPMTTKCGTPYYVAPQVLAGKYDHKCDLWSAGVIMYVMLCGYPPFYGETDVEVLTKVRLGNYSFNAADWKGISEDAKTLIRSLLKMNPAVRSDATQALDHDWIRLSP